MFESQRVGEILCRSSSQPAQSLADFDSLTENVSHVSKVTKCIEGKQKKNNIVAKLRTYENINRNFSKTAGPFLVGPKNQTCKNKRLPIGNSFRHAPESCDVLHNVEKPLIWYIAVNECNTSGFCVLSFISLKKFCSGLSKTSGIQKTSAVACGFIVPSNLQTSPNFC